MTVALIPARGGSKRIPGKNRRRFAGKPMLHYAIDAARRTGIFDRIFVSTDCPEIARCALDGGAEIPFQRPARLAGDTATVSDVLLHAIRRLRGDGCDIRHLCCLVATAPFLRPVSIRAGYRLIRKHPDVDAVVSVTRYPFPIFRAFHRDQDGRMRFFWPEHNFTKSQDLPEAFHDAAQFYWIHPERFLASPRILGGETLPVILPTYLVHDIDTPEDWQAAEVVYHVCKKRGLL